MLALLWGVAFGNIVRGVALDADHEYVGSFLDLLNPFALLTGCARSRCSSPTGGLPGAEDHRGGARPGPVGRAVGRASWPPS